MLNNLKRKKEINQLLILGKKKYKTLIILKKCKFIKILPKLHWKELMIVNELSHLFTQTSLLKASLK